MDTANTIRLKEKLENPVELYREYGYYQFADDGEGIGLREAREQLHLLKLDDDVFVQEVDAVVMESLMELDYINPLLLMDDDTQPLNHWWWHFSKIRKSFLKTRHP